MKDLLFLCHRIPFPPQKGDKIRAYHLLRFLSRHYRVHLGTFIDSPEDWHHVDQVQQMVGGESHFVGLNPTLAKVRSLRGFLTGEALTFPYYRDKKMALWVKGILRKNTIDQIVVYSAALAPYVDGPLTNAPRRVLDFVDMDSDKWLQYAQEKGGINRWIFGREGRKLQKQERKLAEIFHASLFVSHTEAELFKLAAPESSAKIDYWENGVDSDYFSPNHPYACPYPPDQIPLVFTGAMDYRPNVDAVVWFAQEILPLVRRTVPHCQFIIVGGGAGREVLALSALPGVTVTGRVEDVRPYIAHGAVSVAPLRLARGIQNKVLEAMAMGRPVVATSQAMEGIRLCLGLTQWVSDDAEGLAYLIVTLLGENRQPGQPDSAAAAQAGEVGRRCVVERYNWEENLQRVLQRLEG
ncbi:MAG: TIGR03087 family PEP-CTERM/XrtA system glycosyltransferase [Magnetococcales bacterium]|nr:TIGR03087 family PEP-CTERM/XrtA system glycosyltransferase [Magnetococcales bacterium]